MAPRRKVVDKEKKFRWNAVLMNTFMTLCLEWQRLHGTDQPFSWVDIALQFEGKTGKVYDRDTMKNKFDHMKKLWREWKDLKHGETGLGWDAAAGTITADPEWWAMKIQENVEFKKFRRKGIPPEIESMWDQIYGSIVATGQHCVAPSMDPCEANDRQVLEEDDQDDSISDDGFEYLQHIDLDKSDPEVLQDILKRVSAPSEIVASKGAKRNKVKIPDGQGEAKSRKRQSAGSVLYNKHMALVGETSQKMLALYENDVGSSATGASCGKHTVQQAIDEVEDMITEGLLKEGTSLWCFSVEELKNEDSRELFFAIPRNSGRKAWLEWKFEKQKS